MTQKGFTLIEVVMVILILTVLGTISVTNFVLLQKKAELDNAAEEVKTVLILAQNRTLASDNGGQYGVYFDISVSPNKYVLFNGATYATRDTTKDQNFWLTSRVDFSSLSFNGGNEIVFEKLTGFATPSGSVTIAVENGGNTKIVYVSSSGSVGLVAPTAPADTLRVTDSRHITFDYSRSISTTTENISLIFDGSQTEVISISQYMSGGEIKWEGTVTVGGEDQTVKIHTLRLNSPDTRFSVFRDRRYNDVSLEIRLSGDSSGSLLEYSADGQTVTHPSTYVSNYAWQ